MSKICLGCGEEAADSEKTCMSCGFKEFYTKTPEQTSNSFEWQVKCPICGRFYDVGDKNSRIEICNHHTDPVDRSAIADEEPKKKKEPAAPAVRSTPVLESIIPNIPMEQRVSTVSSITMTEIKTGNKITITEGGLIGREGTVENAFFAEDLSVSRKHCILIKDDAFKLEHLPSALNPTKIDGVALSVGVPMILRDGCLLEIAEKILRININ